MIISLIRHGVTDWNEQHRFQGQADIPLNDTGRRQAKALAQRFAGANLRAVVASDLKRAHETARILAEPHAMNVTTRLTWREMALGEFEGRLAAEVRAEHPELMAEWKRCPSTLRMPGAETLAELQRRVVGGFEEVERDYTDGHVAVVAHGFAILTLLTHLLRMDLNSFRQLWIDPTGISRVEKQGDRWVVRSVNDTAHVEA